MNHDPIEELIQSIPLRSPSAECEERIKLEIRHNIEPKSSRIPIVQIILATAASLLFGFYAGTLFQSWSQSETTGLADTGGLANSELKLNSISDGSSFELADHVEVLDGQSKTVIVGESIQLQNNVPIRKVETVTHKKVRVRDQAGHSDKEVEIPIRKTFFTLAETI